MAKNGAYKVKQDVSIPRAVRQIDELPDGTGVYETEGRTYATGDYVLSEDISPPILERVESGELDDFLESASRDEAEAAMRGQAGFGTFIPEHSMEAYILDQHGHTVVPREQVVELMAAGNEASVAAAEEAKADDADERDLPGLPEEEVDEENLPAEKPPGIPVGEAMAEAKGGGGKVKAATTRARPQAAQKAKAPEESKS